MEPWERAVAVVAGRAGRVRAEAFERLEQALNADLAGRVLSHRSEMRNVGRLTLNFHPDRTALGGITVAAGLARQGRYRSQWVTWISSGGRSAVPGGARHRWETELFEGAYEGCRPDRDEFPVYGALDLLCDPHGGSPRFGSCYMILNRDVYDRITFCIGDSHVGPSDVGARAEMVSILAGLAEQAQRGELLDRQLGVDHLAAVLDGSEVISRPARVLDGYVEAQVHGGVDLARDVEAIVVDPSFRGTSIETDLSRVAETYQFALRWHGGSVLTVDTVPHDFRGPGMPALARRLAGTAQLVDAALIGRAASLIEPRPPSPAGDPDQSPAQQLKYLWHTLLAYGTDAEPTDP